MRGLVCASPGSMTTATAIADAIRCAANAAPLVLQIDHAVPLDAVMASGLTDVLIACTNSAELTELLSLLSEVRRAAPACAVVIVETGLSLHEIALLFSAGAYDFTSSSATTDELLARTHRALGLVTTIRIPDVRVVGHPKIKALIGESAPFLKVMSQLPVVAGCDAGALILGETGTGKEIFAQAVHYLSARASRPWIAVNCAAIPADLVENELFGHVRGAYTTAHASQAGLVREAEGGTLFLDEIDNLPFDAQAKLLRFVQTKEYRPVGSSSVVRADVRIIAASNQPLEQLVTAGRFRQDLFYRLNILTLSLPPLRDRRADIPALALHFLQQYASEYRRKVSGFGALALAHLIERSWPGNVRELQHVVERAVLMAHGPLLTMADIEQSGEAPVPVESFRHIKARIVASFERSYVEHLLVVNRGNITSAASAAKKNRRAFWELMRKHKIDPERFRVSQ